MCRERVFTVLGKQSFLFYGGKDYPIVTDATML